jgi:hypothetical protein
VAEPLPRRDQRVTPDEQQARPAPRGGRLTHAWNRAARKTRGLLCALFAAAALSPPLSAPPPSAPAFQEVLATAPQKQTQEKYNVSTQRLDVIEEKMRATEPGRALLQFAADENIRISLSTSKVMDPNPRDDLVVKGRNYSSYVLLNGELRSDDELMLTLVHELRHSWHERTVKTGAMRLGPRHHWLKRRIQEADAFSFEVHFGYEYEKATGKRLDVGDRWNACDGTKPFVCLVEEYRAIREKGTPVDTAYGALLEKGFRHVHAMSYDKTFLTELEGGWSAVVDRPWLGAHYAEMFDKPVTDAAFVEKMRAVCTAGLSPGVDPAALTGWTEADFLSFDKTGGTDRRGMKKLAVAERKFSLAAQAWRLYEPVTAPPPAKSKAPLPKPQIITRQDFSP